VNVNRECIIMSTLALIMALSPVCEVKASMPIPVPDVVHCVVKPGTHNDGPPAIKVLIKYVESAFFNSPEQLLQAANEWKKPDCLLDDGRPKMTVLYYGLVYSVSRDWDYKIGQLREMQKRFPKSDTLALAEAIYWYKFAWHARGGGVASSVSPEGLKLFKQRLRRAEQVLKETKAYSSDLPGWYQTMLDVEFELGRPQETILKTLEEAVQRYKYYYPDYFAMVFYLLPKWGGSWQAVDNFANWSAKSTEPELGDAMYARIYWYVYEKMWNRRTIFSETRISWKKMNASFQTILKRHPKSNWNLNNYAKFACLADDRETFLSLRKIIGQNIMKSAWRSVPIELCEEKFAGRDRQVD